MTTTAQPLTTTATTTAQTALDGIAKLKAQAKETLGEELQAIAETASRDGGLTDNLRLTKHNTLAELVDSTAWLAGDLVDVLLKVAAGHKPHGVKRSDLARRIQEAEVRLEFLRQLSR